MIWKHKNKRWNISFCVLIEDVLGDWQRRYVSANLRMMKIYLSIGSGGEIHIGVINEGYSWFGDEEFMF